MFRRDLELYEKIAAEIHVGFVFVRNSVIPEIRNANHPLGSNFVTANQIHFQIYTLVMNFLEKIF